MADVTLITTFNGKAQAQLDISSASNILKPYHIELNDSGDIKFATSSAQQTLTKAKLDLLIGGSAVDAGTLHNHDGQYYTETELDAGQLDNRYFTETELNAGQLDNQYYTETELDAGQLDNRYFTETELSSVSGTTGSDLVGDDDTYTNFTPSAATVKGAFSGIDIALGAVSNGLSWKQTVRAATTAAGTLATDYENGDTLDGVVLATGDRILIKDAGVSSDKGIYTVNASGAPTRATDMDDGTEADGATVLVMEGTTNADTGWQQVTDSVTIGTTGQDWVNFMVNAIAAGAGLTFSSGVINVVATDTSLTIGTDDMSVNLNSTGGLETSSGVRIKSDSTTANTVGITTTANGAGIKYDSASFTDTAESLELAAGVAGDGLSLTTGVLAVVAADLAGTGIEANTNNLRLSAQGNGIAGGAGSTLSVQSDATGGANLGSVIDVNSNGVAIRVDDDTIEDDGNGATARLRVKAGSIGTNELETSGVTTAKIADDAVDKAKIAADVAGDGLAQQTDGSLDVDSMFISKINANVGTLNAGTVVRLTSATQFDEATADSVANSKGTIGVLLANTATGVAGKIQISGETPLIVVESVITTNLAIGEEVWLSKASAGKVTQANTAGEASATGNTITSIGIASATNKLILGVKPPVEVL